MPPVNKSMCSRRLWSKILSIIDRQTVTWEPKETQECNLFPDSAGASLIMPKLESMNCTKKILPIVTMPHVDCEIRCYLVHSKGWAKGAIRSVLFRSCPSCFPAFFPKLLRAFNIFSPSSPPSSSPTRLKPPSACWRGIHSSRLGP